MTDGYRHLIDGQRQEAADALDGREALFEQELDCRLILFYARSDVTQPTAVEKARYLPTSRSKRFSSSGRNVAAAPSAGTRSLASS